MKHFLPIFLLITTTLYAQNLKPTNNISQSGATDLFTGGYTFSYKTAGSPWNGALISFGGFNNQYDTQFSSDYGVDGGNHISFRTRNGDIGKWNPWQELATKNSNIFKGDQNIFGNLMIDGGITSKIDSEEGGFLSLVNPSKKNQNNVDTWRIYNMTGRYGNSLQFWNYSTDGSIADSRLKISDEGNMALYGKFEAKEIKVTNSPTADFVFENNYNLPSLNYIEKYIQEKKHLPEIASAKEMKEDGVDVGAFQIKLLQKIEELTLYIIDQEKRIKELENKK